MIDVDAKSLSGAILSSLAALGLGSCIIVAQCYDGAAALAKPELLRRAMHCWPGEKPDERPCNRASVT